MGPVRAAGLEASYPTHASEIAMRRVPLALTLLLSASASIAGHASAKDGASATAREVLPFIQDDYAKALAEAKARKLPLFIESWAPW
jgi:hypothetical protein